ncbi:thymidylate kinase [Microplitis mediator]|uniref:thymidylate kinase n=1 Tax=Microplitis mediator TaxID=375433 RepID=UPI00255686C5|nr:thymidylate kinase [Microplitis mediator]
MERGAFLVLEGCDRVGKSTQVKRLVKALNDRGIKAESRGFPDRKTTIGNIIDQFLSSKKDLAPEAVHLLFSANRWECSSDLIKTLNSGVTLVVDRYAASGAAYSATSTKKSLSWCKEPDRGLPAPDLVALITTDEKTIMSREGWANERFERKDFQRKVADNFLKLKDDTWKIVSGDQSIDDIHQVLLEEALKIIEQVKNSPINQLYESQS